VAAVGRTIGRGSIPSRPISTSALSYPPSHNIRHPPAEFVPTSPIASLSLLPTFSRPVFTFLKILNPPHVLWDDAQTEGG